MGKSIRHMWVITFIIIVSVGQGMNTGGTKDYKLVPFDISDTTSLVFEVKACDNIHILLMEDPNNDTNSVYEIAIGKPTILFFIRKR